MPLWLQRKIEEYGEARRRYDLDESESERFYQEERRNAERVMARAAFWVRQIQRDGISWEDILTRD